MPNRIIKESIRTSKNINDLNDFNFRLWLYLITYVDDFGCGSADPELLRCFVFPRRKGVTEKNIAEGLHALACKGLVRLYEVDGEPYFCFPNWSDHQRIQSKKRKFPAPPWVTVTHRESPCVTVSHGDSPLESNPIQSNYNPNPKTNTKGEKASASRFTPPTLDEVKEYVKERGSAVDAEKWFNHYTANGWMVGKNKMKDWKAAVRTWERNDYSGAPAPTAVEAEPVWKKQGFGSYMEYLEATF